MENELPTGKIIAGVVGLFIALIILIVIFPVVIIGAGERGVIFNNTTGVEDKILGEGIHFRIPFVQSVKKMSVKVQKNEVKAQAASKDMQTVNTTVVINWHLDANKVNNTYQTIGSQNDVIDTILTPNVIEVVKAATSQYTAEETLTKRQLLKENIDAGLSIRLAQYNIVLDDVSITDIDFSEEFNKAIEAKATAEQTALAERNKLETVKYQAQQSIETAKATAETIRIQAEAINKQGGADYVNLKAIEKWNGALPTTFIPGSSIPFLNMVK